jgi:hypothetical protein
MLLHTLIKKIIEIKTNVKCNWYHIVLQSGVVV